MSKKIEISFIIHLAILGLIFLGLYKFYNINIFDEAYKSLENFKTVAIKEIDTMVNYIENNPEEYEMDEFSIARYEIYNKMLIDESNYYMYYYMPSLCLLIILGIVLIENFIYRKIKMSYMCMTYDSQKDGSKDKLRKIIREKLNYKYRRIILPKHVPYTCIILYFITNFVNINNDVILRSFNNMIFALTLIIAVYGIRIAIKLFKTKSEFLRFFVIMANIFLFFIIPQIYFMIGFFKSLVTVRVIIKMD